jgi:hypothetical protein
MNSILAVERGLPPGLWLPRADESTEQYLHKNFDHPDLTHEDLVDYGSFIVSLISIEQENTGRVSLMPRRRDVVDMYQTGYGVSINKIDRYHGGARHLQRALGFYPINYEPQKEEMLERFQWMAEYAYPYEPSPNYGGDPTIYDIIEWGSVRHLTPSTQVVYKLMEGDTTEIREMFGLKIKKAADQADHASLYHFGARVLQEHGRMLKRDELNALYSHEFPHKPSHMIKAKFGAYRNFWTEFDFVPDTHGMKPDQFLSIGLRRAIACGRATMTAGELEQHSSEGRFISRLPIYKHFGSKQAYFNEVELLYEDYLRQQAEFADHGVAPDVFQAACRMYEPTPEFKQWLQDHKDTLVKLSDDSLEARYVTGIMKGGLDILNKETYEWQINDIQKYLHRLGIKDRGEHHFVFDVIPRVCADEVVPPLKTKD